MAHLKRDSERERGYDRLNLGQGKILSPHRMWNYDLSIIGLLGERSDDRKYVFVRRLTLEDGCFTRWAAERLMESTPIYKVNGSGVGHPQSTPPPTQIKNGKGVRFDLRATSSWIFVEKGWEVTVALSFYSRSRLYTWLHVREVFFLLKSKYNRDCHFWHMFWDWGDLAFPKF